MVQAVGGCGRGDRDFGVRRGLRVWQQLELNEPEQCCGLDIDGGFGAGEHHHRGFGLAADGVRGGVTDEGVPDDRPEREVHVWWLGDA